MSEAWISLAIPIDHPAYAGHFPGRPILPGVVLLDAALHALTQQEGRSATGAQIKSAKFLSPVAPGESLNLHCEQTPSGDFRFDIRCGDRAVASGVIVLADAA